MAKLVLLWKEKKEFHERIGEEDAAAAAAGSYSLALCGQVFWKELYLGWHGTTCSKGC